MTDILNGCVLGGFFLWMALVKCCIGLFALWRMTRRASIPLEDQGTFVSMPPRASPVAVTLNPETPEDAADWEEIPPDFDPMAQETEEEQPE